MKKLMILGLVCTGFFHAQAQKLKEADVPANVKTAFQKLYPNTKVEEWEKEGANYEAEFDVNKTETSVVLDASGTLLETETEIAPTALPKAAHDYLAQNMPKAKVHEASKITKADGTVSYEAEVDKADYLFDANGNFIKKEVETATEKKDKEKK